MHAFDAAKSSGFKGYFFFPQLDASIQMPKWTRESIAAKVDWLYNNLGAVRVVIDGLGLDEVDTGLWPKAATDNRDFNREVTEAFDNECGEARVFDEAAVENVYTAQLALRRHIRLHGELFGQMLRAGEGSRAPSMSFIPTWRIDNAATRLDQSKWIEGTRSNEAGRVLEYRLPDPADRSKFRDVPADDILHFRDPFFIGQKRGVSGLAPVARKLFSIDDIERAETAGVLLRSLMAYAITRKETDDGAPVMLPGVIDTEEVETPDGRKILIQKVAGLGNDEVNVANLPPGLDIKVIESNRSTEPVSFTKHLLSDVSYCTLYPPEYVFYLAGIGQGTLARMVQKRVQRIKNTVRQFQLMPQFIRRWYVFWLWQRIKSGRFDKVKGGIPDNWYRHKIIYPADDSVDVGREGRLYDERLATGKMSPADYHGMQGRDDEDVEDEIIEAAVRKALKVKAAREANPDVADELTSDRIFRPPAGSAATPIDPGFNDDEDDDPKPPDPKP